MTLEAPIDRDRKLIPLAAAIAGLLCIAFAVRTAAAWKRYHHIDPTAGVWTAAALDARDGILYRPIESNLGYGGSRYAPLHIVLQAGLMRAGLGPVAAGYLLDFFGIVLVVGGIYALLRQLQIAPLLAGVMAGFTLGSYCYCTTAGGLKGDLLAVAASMWGLAATVASQRLGKSSLLIAAGICFALAIAAKLTSIFGIASSVIWLGIFRKWKAAALLASVWAIAVIIAAIATQWASDGRALKIFELCASGGGGLRQFLRGPHRIISDAIHVDRFFACFWLLAAGLIVLDRNWKGLPTILFVLTTLATVAIYGSPGTNSNHLVDLQAASIIVIAVSIPTKRSALIAVCALALFAAVNHVVKTIGIWREDRHGQMIAALIDADRSGSSAPLLAENPILPILDGQRPYMLDSFMFRTLWRRNPKIAERLWIDLSNQYFRAVILAAPPTDPTRATDAGDFGPGFMQRLQQNYVLISNYGGNWVYLPKPR